MIDPNKLKEMKAELYALYQKALVKEDYEHIVELTGKYVLMLKESNETPDTIASTILDGKWAEYYGILKFPEGFSDKDRFDFLKGLYKMKMQAADPVNIAEILYLESIAWSYLVNDQEMAEQCSRELQELILAGKVPVAQILKSINARVAKEMKEQKWEVAISTANEIKKFPEEILTLPDNIGALANIINNRGASKNRGKIDPVEGAMDLLQAADYYSQQPQPAVKHFSGLPDRLRESLENMQSMTLGYGVGTHAKIFRLIKEAQSLLQPVSEEIEQGRVSTDCFETLRTGIREIRNQIVEAKYGKKN